jgi:cytochrome b561
MNMTSQDYSYPWYAKLLHLGMAAFGIAAYVTGELAEDGYNSLGYLFHAYLGLSLATFVLMRVLRGLVGPGPLRFSDWSPLSRRQWTIALQDLGNLVRFRVPERGMHEGLAGLTQAFGIAIFAWMGATGIGLFLLGGGPETELFEVAEEYHEVGEALIPLYLALHVGSVFVHSLAGNPIWRKMWTFRTTGRLRQAGDPN